MRNIDSKTLNIAFPAIVAAVYTGLGFVFAPISFGTFQVRIAEALTILPVLTPYGIWGLTLGCLISNAAGVVLGANIAGALDIIVGTSATLISALLSKKYRNVLWFGLPVLSTLFPVFINALFVGAELCVVLLGKFTVAGLMSMFLSIVPGQLLSCTVLGLILYKGLFRFKEKIPGFYS